MTEAKEAKEGATETGSGNETEKGTIFDERGKEKGKAMDG
eukprot:CAMPEP_0116977494 /NCGR_PEP_ID=MMETSP0467-20121206/57173_1 /TAXON_ID=283647 /ORGANISM="Mesodinium pulex, Strain SPMC105" /LENGTH=39 /DNA_ID= /DNA_START= /DNA_END= /DNA_ORIENTATION=